jgi:hypothetical protein
LRQTTSILNLILCIVRAIHETVSAFYGFAPDNPFPIPYHLFKIVSSSL